MIAANNLTGDGIQMKTLEELVCSPTLTSGSQQPSIHLAVLNIFLSLTAILGNSLILVALRKGLCIGFSKFTNNGIFVDTQEVPATYQAMHFVEYL